MEVSHLNLDHLRPPKSVFDIVHKGDYMLQIEGKQYIRRIFHDVFYTKYEGDKLVEFKAIIDKAGITLPPDWTSEETLKFLHSTQFNIKKSLKHLKFHLNWRANIPKELPTERIAQILQTGVVYISGRDKEYRPIFIIDLPKIKTNNVNLKDFLDALSLLLCVAKTYYFVHGKVENWIIIIEAGGISLPYKTMKKVLNHTIRNFPSTLEKLYIMNPSKLLKGSWNFICRTIDLLTRTKISLIQKSQYSQLLDNIAISQIEKRYGGTLKEFESYWPPVNTLSLIPYNQIKLVNEEGSDLNSSKLNNDSPDGRSHKSNKNKDRKASHDVNTRSQQSEDEYIDEEIEESIGYQKESRRPHVSKFQSFRKRSTHLSTIREESYEEGYTSIQEGGTLKRLSARKSRQKSRKFLSTVLLKQMSDKTEVSPSPTNRGRMSVPKEGFDSFSFADHPKIEISLEGKPSVAVCCQFQESKGDSCNMF